MDKRFVYLAGPINGNTEKEATSWRQYVTDRIGPNIVGISPLRFEGPPKGEVYGPIVGDEADPKFGTPRAIASKNLIDVKNCDMVLAYLPKWSNDRKPSYGTVQETGWATALGKPVILVSDDPNVASHPVFVGTVNWVVPTLDDAITVIHGIWDDYVGERK